MKNKLLVLSMFICSTASVSLNASIFNMMPDDNPGDMPNPMIDDDAMSPPVTPVAHEQASVMDDFVEAAVMDIPMNNPIDLVSFNQNLEPLQDSFSYSSPASQDFCQNVKMTFKTVGDPIPVVDWLNGMQLDSFYQTTFHRLPFQKKYDISIKSQGRYNLAVEPYGFSSKFKLRGQNFNLKTLGITTAGNFTLEDSWVLGGGIGYSHSNLNWQHLAKKTRVNSLYFGPQATYLTKSGYLQLMVAGIYNMYDAYSSLITGLRTSNHHTGWDILAKVGGGVDIEVGVSAFFIQPNVDLRYLGVLQNSYKEKGANGLKAKVKSGYTDFFRSKLAFEFWKEFYKKNSGFLIPSVSIGWVSMQPLSEGKKTVCEQTPRTAPKSYPHSNQLYVGAKLTGIHKRGVLLALGFDANIAKVYPVCMGNVRVEIDW